MPLDHNDHEMLDARFEMIDDTIRKASDANTAALKLQARAIVEAASMGATNAGNVKLRVDGIMESVYGPDVDGTDELLKDGKA